MNSTCNSQTNGSLHRDQSHIELQSAQGSESNFPSNPIIFATVIPDWIMASKKNRQKWTCNFVQGTSQLSRQDRYTIKSDTDRSCQSFPFPFPSILLVLGGGGWWRQSILKLGASISSTWLQSTLLIFSSCRRRSRRKHGRKRVGRMTASVSVYLLAHPSVSFILKQGW